LVVAIAARFIKDNKDGIDVTEVKEVDIVICGAGLVGLALGAALTQSDLHVLILDAQSQPQTPADTRVVRQGFDLVSGFAPRVSALNKSSIAFLKRIGVWGSVSRSSAFVAMSVKDAVGTGAIEFDADFIGASELGRIVENRRVIDALLLQLADADQTEVVWDSKLDDMQALESGYELTLDDGSQISCALVIGADGGHSKIRELANLKTVAWSYHQQGVVCNIETQHGHGQVARQWFTERGPLAFLPLEPTNLCSIVWSVENPEDLMAMSAEEFCRELASASEQELGGILGVDKRFTFPLNQQHSLRYIKPHLALIGDAAHTIHPLAGQGANLGFADAEALASELLQYRFSERGIGDFEALRRYEKSRQPSNLLMTTAMEAFKRLYSTTNPGINWLRNTGMKLTNDNTYLKTLIARLASGGG
jgi:2-polyprenylphenol 6-hydroxylase